MFKKILIIVGVSVSLLSLTACNSGGGSYTAFELYERSLEQMEDIDSLIIEFDMKAEYSVAGTSEQTDMSLLMSLEMLGEDNANLAASGSAMGIEIDLYFRDGYMYTEAMGERSREAMDFDEAFEMTGGNLIGSTIEEDSIESSSVESIAGGGYRLNFALDPVSMIAEAFGDSIAGIPFSEDMIDGGTIDMTFYIDADYYMTRAIIEMDFSFTMLGETMLIYMEMDATYVQLGNVTVAFPDWLDGFGATDNNDLQAYLDMVRAGGDSVLGDVGVGDMYLDIEVGEGNEFIYTLEDTVEGYEGLIPALDVEEGIGFFFVAMANDYRNAFGVEHFRFTYLVVDVETGEELGRFHFDSD